jgi:hypothetical protein
MMKQMSLGFAVLFSLLGGGGGLASSFVLETVHVFYLIIFFGLENDSLFLGQGDIFLYMTYLLSLFAM